MKVIVWIFFSWQITLLLLLLEDGNEGSCKDMVEMQTGQILFVSWTEERGIDILTNNYPLKDSA